MPTNFHPQQPESSANDKKTDTESQPILTSDQVKAGTKVIMTHAERQTYLKKSGLAELFGVADLLP
ncbi:hypothetical protein IQ264_23880 [Phormidium sp. LEGE 05292]|uniref:hypothetical protein n=1 Tax=[Phormidium] sp. LEGE 05292 TaxID=767427 RepID=UPI00187EA8F5|nr:hypothetical protein [Phormidium sp. LEGE 05292]MBE9228462.1 hypothetical protein [Phormidium sp. LEGE 05292]